MQPVLVAWSSAAMQLWSSTLISINNETNLDHLAHYNGMNSPHFRSVVQLNLHLYPSSQQPGLAKYHNTAMCNTDGPPTIPISTATDFHVVTGMHRAIVYFHALPHNMSAVCWPPRHPNAIRLATSSRQPNNITIPKAIIIIKSPITAFAQ